MAILKQHRIGLVLGALATVVVLGAALSCDQDALVNLNITGDVVYSDVELRLYANGGAVQQSFPDATFGPSTIYKVGLYLPTGLTGTVTITADALRNKCIIGTKSITLTDIRHGESVPPVSIQVASVATTCPLGAGGAGGAHATGGAGGAVTPTGGKSNPGTGGAGGKPAVSTGGIVAVGGSMGSGGILGTGGVIGTGGIAATGGSGSGGEMVGSGGRGSGGVRGTGGREGTGGVRGTGGRDMPGTGGIIAEGGRDGRGGERGRGRGGERGTGGEAAGGEAGQPAGGEGGQAAGGEGGGLGLPIPPGLPVLNLLRSRR